MKKKQKKSPAKSGFVSWEIKSDKIKSADELLNGIAKTDPEEAKQIKDALLSYVKGNKK